MANFFIISPIVIVIYKGVRKDFTMVRKIYYTYLLIDPQTNVPFYVGKGKRNRMYMHRVDALTLNGIDYKNNRPHHKLIRELETQGLRIKYQKILERASEKEALDRERETIKEIGRKLNNTGPLLNTGRGGHIGGETCKSVCQYDLNSNLISIYPSIIVAAECTGANRSYISQCCKGKRKSAGGFLWSYENNPIPVFNKKYYRSVLQLSKDGSLIATYRSLTEAQNQTHVELHNISECCRGKSKTAGGFVWKYVD